MTVPAQASPGKTLQQYIDEAPVWPDGTRLKRAPMTGMQWRIWSLATAGKFFEGLVVFMTGVALPLISHQFALTALQKGIVSAITLFGILVGATALGGLADVFGRKRMFIAEMVLFVGFLVLLTVSPDVWWMSVALFGIGLALGCDYPTAHVVISESVPSHGRGALVLGAFAFQAIGAIAGAGLGIAIMALVPTYDAWRWMYGAAIVPAVLVIFGRLYIVESAHWLVAKGRLAEAQAAAQKLLKREPQYPKNIELCPQANAAHHHPKLSIGALFQGGNRRATLLASLPWFLQDLGTYGIGIFTPVILAAALGAASAGHDMADVLANASRAARGTIFLDMLLLFGVLAAILLVERAGRISLQVVGFIGCAVGLALAAVALNQPEPVKTLLLFSGFMLFNFMTNLGPNAQTYLLAGEVFPTSIRGYGAGFAASFAKIGAVMTAFFFPVLMHAIGTATLLWLLMATSLLGAVVTWALRIDTRGDISQLGLTTPEASMPHPGARAVSAVAR